MRWLFLRFSHRISVRKHYLCSMKKIIWLFALLLSLPLAATAQIVVDLKKGGAEMRMKTADDYRRERAEKEPPQFVPDTVAYRDHLVRALNALHADSLEEARSLFNGALKIYPKATTNFVVRHNLCRIDMAQGRIKEAVEGLSALLSDKPDALDARMDRATCYLQMGYAKGCVQDCDVLLRNAPSDSLQHRILLLRAAAQMQQKAWTAADHDLRTLLSLDPLQEDASLLLAMCLREEGKKQEAADRLDLMINQNPRNADAMLLRAGWYEEEKQWALARYDYDQALTLRPDDAQTYLRRAYVLAKLGNDSLARQDLEQAAKLGAPRLTLKDLK